MPHTAYDEIMNDFMMACVVIVRYILIIGLMSVI